MKKETYEHITAPLRSNQKLANVIIALNKTITLAIYIAYPALLIWLFLTDGRMGLIVNFSENGLFIRALFVPLVSFILLSVFRTAVNAKRPYEVFGMSPILAKDTQGKSFPSRHVFSIFVIAMTFLFILGSPVLGITILILGILLSVARVILGVHFPRDVIAGALFGIIAGIIGFYLV